MVHYIYFAVAAGTYVKTMLMVFNRLLGSWEPGGTHSSDIASNLEINSCGTLLQLKTLATQIMHVVIQPFLLF